LKSNGTRRFVGETSYDGWYQWKPSNPRSSENWQLHKCFLSKLSCNTDPGCRPLCYIDLDLKKNVQWEDSGKKRYKYRHKLVDIDGNAYSGPLYRGARRQQIEQVCDACMDERLMGSEIDYVEPCSLCDEFFKASCFWSAPGCGNCFETMKNLMVDVAEELLRAGISLYLDWKDTNAENLIAAFMVGQAPGTRWTQALKNDINAVLQNRVGETYKLIYMPGSTGDYCLAELQAGKLARGDKLHIPHPIGPGRRLTWLLAVAKFQSGDPDDLVGLIASVCQPGFT